MEQQTISIAKAGVICQLKCRVGIIASANPVNGCYNRAKSFKDNTKISNAILSRFDLIFLLVDKPDPERDRKLVEHIMKIHNNKRKRKLDDDGKASQSFNLSQYDQCLSLADKYNKVCEMEKQTYTLERVKKYLTFVKQEIHPTLSREACEVIKGFYIVLRENCPTNAFQITNRQLESMVRLAMARARI
jgi:DNA helicase MCM8